MRLATIHDEICEDARPINPYAEDEPLVRRKRAQPRLLYAIRMGEVQCLEDDDRPVLERALADVASELGLRNPLQGTGGAPSIVLQSARQTTRPNMAALDSLKLKGGVVRWDS